MKIRDKESTQEHVTEEGISLTIYGWEKTEKREIPVVYLEMSMGSFHSHMTMAPDEARDLADSLIKMAEAAEK